jgi:hypothetical protein
MKRVDSILSRYSDDVLMVCAFLIMVLPFLGLVVSLFSGCYELQVVLLIVFGVCLLLGLMLFTYVGDRKLNKGGVK